MASEAFRIWWRSVVNPAGRDPEDLAMEARAAAVEACTAEVEAAGCSCLSLNCGDTEFDGEFDDDGKLVGHDSRCPKALAARLRRLA